MNTITTCPSTDRHSALLEEVRRIVDQLPAAELLARQPHTRLPLMSWVVEDGMLVGRPPPHAEPAEARQACDAWTAHLELDQHCGGSAHGHVDGIRVTVLAD